MKYSFLLLLFVFFRQTAFTQQANLPVPSPSFIAIIVTDIDSSIQWYTTKLGCSVVNRVDMQSRGFRQANLELGSLQLELIETSTTIDPAELLKDQPPKTRIAGFFKFGMRVTDFDGWLDHLHRGTVPHLEASPQRLMSTHHFVERSLQHV